MQELLDILCRFIYSFAIKILYCAGINY